MVVADAVLQRTELWQLYDVLQWSDDGSLAVNTSSQLTILKPKYVKDDVKINFKNITNTMFDTEKIELELLPRNNLYLNEIHDESVSTLFTTTDVAVSKFKWSPLSSTNETFLAVLTNRASLLVFKNGKLFVDLTSNIIADAQAELNDNIVTSFDWFKNSNNGLELITGLASGNTMSYSYDDGKFAISNRAKVAEQSIVSIKSFEHGYIAVGSTNEIFINQNNELKKLKGSDRFRISDILFLNNFIYFTTTTKLSRISIINQRLESIEIGLISTSKILQVSPSELIIVSDSRTIKINVESFEQINENIIEPIIQNRLNKWNANFNDFNTKIFKLKVFGVDLNYSGNIMAILYEIQNVNGFKYKISSENTFKISFIPINSNNFNNEPSSLAIFQNYKLTGNLQSFNNSSNGNSELDLSLNMKEYLNAIMFNNTNLKNAAIQNLISGNQDALIRKSFAELIINYIQKNNIIFHNDIDKIVYNNYLSILGHSANDPTFQKEITFKTNSFEQTFNFTENNLDLEKIKSTDGIIWTRCSLTFLPILTPNVLADPVTEKRIIDIKRDSLNSYGDFTKSILDLNFISLYSGSSYIEK